MYTETSKHESSQRFSKGLPSGAVIFGTTAAMHDIRQEIEKLAATDLPVLIEGESGTGKDVLARWIHANSLRRKDPFVKIHCPAIPRGLLESKLSGYEAGAFRSAPNSKTGCADITQGGTVYFDKVSELELELQANMLQLIQDGRFTRIGSWQERPAEARFICSTRRSLADLAEMGDFRKDLFYRINAVRLQLPPLRKRLADMPILVDYLLEACERKFGGPVKPFSAELMMLMQACTWPGNIRQLENLTKRYVVLGCEEETISAELLNEAGPDPLCAASAKGRVTLKKVVREVVRKHERKIILRSLHTHRWNRKETARALGISYQALLYKMRQDQLCAPGPEGMLAPGGAETVN